MLLGILIPALEVILRGQSCETQRHNDLCALLNSLVMMLEMGLLC